MKSEKNRPNRCRHDHPHTPPTHAYTGGRCQGCGGLPIPGEWYCYSCS